MIWENRAGQIRCAFLADHDPDATGTGVEHCPRQTVSVFARMRFRVPERYPYWNGSVCISCCRQIRARRTGRTGYTQKCSGKAVHEFVFVSALTNALDRPLPNGYFVSMRSHDRDTPTRNGPMRVSCRDYNSSSRTGTGTGV